MLWRILTGGLIGGLLGGAVVAAIQAVTTIPLILHAETYEAAANHNAIMHLVHAQDHTAMAASNSGAARFALTLIATVAVATGYAWMLLAAMFARGETITARSVVPWAVAAFAAAGLAPALGLAPELPGAVAADLAARQIWWLFAVVASAGGFAAIFTGRTPFWILIGLAAIVLPHLVGAPHPDGVVSRVPAGIAAQFVSASLVVQSLMWILPGVIAGYVVSRLSPS